MREITAFVFIIFDPKQVFVCCITFSSFTRKLNPFKIASMQFCCFSVRVEARYSKVKRFEVPHLTHVDKKFNLNLRALKHALNVTRKRWSVEVLFSLVYLRLGYSFRLNPGGIFSKKVTKLSSS